MPSLKECGCSNANLRRFRRRTARESMPPEKKNPALARCQGGAFLNQPLGSMRTSFLLGSYQWRSNAMTVVRPSANSGQTSASIQTRSSPERIAGKTQATKNAWGLQDRASAKALLVAKDISCLGRLQSSQ